MRPAIPDRSFSRPLVVAALLLGLSGAAAAQSTAPQPAVSTEQPWWKGRVYSWASAGTTFAYGQTYGSANLGVGWLMRSGIAPNVELGYAFGNSPTIWSLRPGVSWYLPIPTIRPYVGAYYTHWFVGDGLADQNGVGGRAGLSIGRVLALGVIYEHALGCSQNCDSWAPQISAGYSF